MRKRAASWSPAAVAFLLLCALRGSVALAEESKAAATAAPSEFHVAVCEHYHVQRDVVVVIHGRGVPDEHLPVVFLLAERCHVAPAVIVDLRLKGKSWMDIALHFGHHAEIFHVVVVRDHGPPYGKAFGYYKRPRAEWAAIRLADDDIVALANLKFVSAHHGLSADEVIEMRHKDDDFVKLQSRVKAASALGAAKKEEKGAEPRGRGKDAASPAKDGKGGREHGGAFPSEGGGKGSGAGKGAGQGGGRGKGK